MSDDYEAGAIGWLDMTTGDAPAVRDFYEAVAGWGSDEVATGDYSDFMMRTPASGRAVAGICHARGVNADLPPGWLIYIMVEDLEASTGACIANGGDIVVAPRDLAGGRFCVIRDPGGSVAALYQAKAG